MPSFNSITIDLSPITDQIEGLRAQLYATQARLERAEDRIRDLERALSNPNSTRPNPRRSQLSEADKDSPHAAGGLGRGLGTLINNQKK